MKIVSNLDKWQHKRVENYIFNVNSIPLIFNFINDYFCQIRKTNISELQVYELISFDFKDGNYFLVYEKKELQRTDEKTIEQFKQLRLL